MYSESIEKLKGVLQAMQNASQKREKLEKQLREQLQSEISQLKGGGAGAAGTGRTNSKQREKQTTPSEIQQQILLLEADVAKVCLCYSMCLIINSGWVITLNFVVLVYSKFYCFSVVGAQVS